MAKHRKIEQQAEFYLFLLKFAAYQIVIRQNPYIKTKNYEKRNSPGNLQNCSFQGHE